MTEKSTYEHLEQMVKELEKEVVEHRYAKEALLESEERYRKLFEHAGFAITLTDAQTIEQVSLVQNRFFWTAYSPK